MKAKRKRARLDANTRAMRCLRAKSAIAGRAWHLGSILARDFVPWVRAQLDEADRPHCAYCGRLLDGDNLALDERLPFSRGGLNELDNYRLCCRGCNYAKASSLPEEWEALIGFLKGAGLMRWFFGLYRAQPRPLAWFERVSRARRGEDGTDEPEEDGVRPAGASFEAEEDAQAKLVADYQAKLFAQDAERAKQAPSSPVEAPVSPKVIP
jgi:hypothetical protein